MANRKSFLLHLDFRRSLDLLTMEGRGQLLTSVFDYVEAGVLPEFEGTEQNGLQMAFSFLQAKLNRDAEKYEAICERNRINGAKGGRPENPVGYLGTQRNPKRPTVKVREKETVGF